MKFCSILPLKNAELMYENDYVMLLAHLSKKSANYADLARLNTNYKIMDNSIIELGEAFSMEDLVKEAVKCNANEIILPDVFEDGYKTIEAIKDSIEWLKRYNLIGRFKLMAVCHGKNMDEFQNTLEQLVNIPEIDVIGIPKVISSWLGSRVKLAERMASYFNKEIHLLGCWNSLEELKEISQCSKIRSMDTCLPALLSIYKMDTFDDRRGLTINLEKDEIDKDRYNNIMKEINEVLKVQG